ncbi:MAG: class II fructose-bisphosphatase [Pseudomonadota bacterium]
MSDASLQAFLDRVLTIEIVRVTERAAVAAARLRGRGDEVSADQAAVDAMRRELNALPFQGTVVIGEGERDEAPMLFIGEEVGAGGGPLVDIALDPLEGTTICAKNLPNSIAVIAVAEKGTLLNAPDVYMEKIAAGPGYPEGMIDLDRPIADVLHDMAKFRDVGVEEITTCVLDRPRHTKLIDDIRHAGASIRLIGDGDVAGVIHTSDPEETGIDIYAGIGGAPEGVLAAAALRCIGGQMQGRLHFRNDEERGRATRMGIEDLDRKYTMNEMASGDVIFAATGVTDGNLLDGVRFGKRKIKTDSIVMRSTSRTVRWVRAEHDPAASKFDHDRRA